VEDDSVRARGEIGEVVSGQGPIEPVIRVQVIELGRRGAAAVALRAGVGQEVRLDRVATAPARLIAAVEGRVQVVGALAARCGILEDEPEERVAAGRHRLRHQDDLVLDEHRDGIRLHGSNGSLPTSTRGWNTLKSR